MSLFLKVFLWFWLAMALVIGALFAAIELTRPEERFTYSGMDHAMTTFGQFAASAYERGGPEGLRQFFERHGAEPARVFFLFDEQGAELTGREATPAVREAARRAGAEGRIVRARANERMSVAHPVTTEGGRRYVFTDLVPPRPPGRFSADPASQALRVLAVLLTAGLLCYLLARYIVSPVVKLREATKRVAGGDFSARVGPLLGSRQDELAEMGRDFDVMAARIESLMGAQQRLLRDISHELRSPLARLAVALDLARKRAGPGAEGALARIEREAARLNEMIGQLLSLSRREAGDRLESAEAVDLAALLGDVAEDADFEARGRGREVRVTECDACGVRGAPLLLRSAVENVVRNAVRHAPEATAVRVSLRCAGGEAVIRVEDEGAGVPEESLKDIFRPFYRVGDARDRETGGAGLGLAITERAVRLHGGTVGAANLPGRGFAVEMRLPLDGEAARG